MQICKLEDVTPGCTLKYRETWIKMFNLSIHWETPFPSPVMDYYYCLIN